MKFCSLIWVITIFINKSSNNDPARPGQEYSTTEVANSVGGGRIKLIKINLKIMTEGFRKMTPEEQATAMNLEDAQSEANILRDITFQDTKGHFDEVPVTKEEYDKAFGDLTKLLNQAEKETIPEKIKLLLQRFHLRSKQIAHALVLIPNLANESLGLPNSSKLIQKEIRAMDIDIDIRESYSQKLKDLKERAKAFEEMPKE